MRVTALICLLALAPLAAAASDKPADKKPEKPAGPAELQIGKNAPEFSLPGTDGKTYTFKDAAGPKGTLVIFTCNHCPYAQGYQDRIIDLTEKYKSQGIGVVAISSNDVKAYPDDGFDKMKERAEQKEYPFPYLFDETQAVALKYGPKVTPHVFLFDAKGKLVYRGRIDDSLPADKVTKRELTDALDAVVEGKPVAVAETKAFGCGVKWKADVAASFKKTS